MGAAFLFYRKFLVFLMILFLRFWRRTRRSGGTRLRTSLGFWTRCRSGTRWRSGPRLLTSLGFWTRWRSGMRWRSGPWFFATDLGPRWRCRMLRLFGMLGRLRRYRSDFWSSRRLCRPLGDGVRRGADSCGYRRTRCRSVVFSGDGARGYQCGRSSPSRRCKLRAIGRSFARMLTLSFQRKRS